MSVRSFFSLNTLLNPKTLHVQLLAQCLVRRSLFPTSDCLKASTRTPLLFAELASRISLSSPSPSPTSPPSPYPILCLQETDRLPSLLPFLSSLSYTSHTYRKGTESKKHGCLIAWREADWVEVASKGVWYDDEDVRGDVEMQGVTNGVTNLNGTGEKQEESNPQSRKGSSFKTKNVANLVALSSTSNPSSGIIIATTHLFWHPKYTYERTRQTGILLRESLKFRSQINPSWPVVIAGDFNHPPSDPSYSLLFNQPLTPEDEQRLEWSRVVHVSLDPSVALTSRPPVANGEAEGEEAGGEGGDGEEGGEGEGEEEDPDMIITHARKPTPQDGLLSTPELHSLFSPQPSIKSAYEEGLKTYLASQTPSEGIEKFRTFGDRADIGEGRKGRYEPEYTSYTHWWKATLDYIFIIDPPPSPRTNTETSSHITGLLKPLSATDLAPLLPRKGLSGSDHLSLMAEITWVESSPVDP
ncbi:hypothetical protein JAAARDRAFT_169698 [Jaapia argillacea MUCL 33604]|uniref:Endonuclease/exonuclease/phosphatase domain-containing protein n=1 Tax=Jaapia argillacea MUCL 33604 TaxID=933084 RepID=A0A067QLX4_9AGAM|nr:hypothetical protein JAAARDRAFT_169698 [Jaapia argillacea MUCL 33604]